MLLYIPCQSNSEKIPVCLSAVKKYSKIKEYGQTKTSCFILIHVNRVCFIALEKPQFNWWLCSNVNRIFKTAAKNNTCF